MNIVKLNEEQLKNIIAESIKKVVSEGQFNEEEMEEGWLGDKWNQMKTAANTFTQKTDANGMGMKDRFQKAKANWNTQGELNNINNLRQILSDMLDARQISPNTTVAQLVGGKYNNGKFGTMSGMVANRRNQIARRGGSAN